MSDQADEKASEQPAASLQLQTREYPHAGAVELPTLKSILIEVRRGDARLATATGIVLARNSQSHCAVITNRHVVTGRHQDTGQTLNGMGAIPDNVAVHFHAAGDGWDWKVITLPLYRSAEEPVWIEHPRLGASADIVALNVRWGTDVRLFPYYLDTQHDRIGMDVRPAEPVSVIGFPFGQSSAKTFPIWATGFLAQELTLVTRNDPVFLIDCRSRPGQSGSAVVAFRSSGHRVIVDGKVMAQLSHGTAWEFLGVYSGRINAESDLGRVWHVDVLGELLDAANEDYQRRGELIQEAER